MQNWQVLYSYDYDAFGNEKSPNAEYDGNPFRYCGEYYNREIENVYLRARYYDSSTGRFTQEDPIKDGLNWYNYCGHNPVKFADPNGLIATSTKNIGPSTTAADIAKRIGEKAAEKKRRKDIITKWDEESKKWENRYFDTMDEAAIDFSEQFYNRSRYSYLEMGTIIYSIEREDADGNMKTYYSYTLPEFGGPHNTEEAYGNARKSIPENGIEVATAHTHPTTYDFSRPDRDNAKSRNEPNYVVTSNRRVLKYAKTENGWTQSEIARKIQLRALEDWERRYIEEVAAERWNKHIYDEPACFADCKGSNIPWPNPYV